MAKKTNSRMRHHVDRRLLFRLIIYGVIAVAMLSIVGFDIVVGVLNLKLAGIGLIVGFVVGDISAHTYKLTYNKDVKKVVARMDLFGGILLVFYIIFSIERRQLIGYFVHGPAVAAVSFAIVAGVMIGRLWGTRRKILRVLKDEKIM